jgi:hypothetical protein
VGVAVVGATVVGATVVGCAVGAAEGELVTGVLCSAPSSGDE